MRNAHEILVEKPARKRHLGDLGIDERKILKRTLNKQGVDVDVIDLVRNVLLGSSTDGQWKVRQRNTR
jgi:hypothetical protein